MRRSFLSQAEELQAQAAGFEGQGTTPASNGAEGSGGGDGDSVPALLQAGAAAAAVASAARAAQLSPLPAATQRGQGSGDQDRQVRAPLSSFPRSFFSALVR